jgi:hypothetical protein
MPDKVYDLFNWHNKKVGELGVWVHNSEAELCKVAVSAMIQVVQEGEWDDRMERIDGGDKVNPSLRTLASVKLRHVESTDPRSRERQLEISYEGRNRPDFYQNMRRVVLAAILALPDVLVHPDALYNGSGFPLLGITVTTKGKQVPQEKDIDGDGDRFSLRNRSVLDCPGLDHARGPQTWRRTVVEYKMALATCKQAEGYVVVMDLLCKPNEKARRKRQRQKDIEWNEWVIAQGPTGEYKPREIEPDSDEEREKKKRDRSGDGESDSDCKCPQCQECT